MFKKIAYVGSLFVVIMIIASAFAQTPRTSYTDYYPTIPSNWIQLRDWIQYEELRGQVLTPRYLGTTIAEEGRLLFTVLNKEGDTLDVGATVVWDTTRIAVCDTAAGKTARIEIDLSDEGGAHSLYVYAASGSSSDDSLWIYGLDADGAAQSETLPITDGDDQVLTASAYWWTQIDSVMDSQATSGWTTYQVIALPICGVRASDQAEGDFAGVVVGGKDASGAWEDYIPDNDIGFVCIQGMTDARIETDGSYLWPGQQLYPAAGGCLGAFTAVTGTISVSQDSILAVITQDSLNTVDPDEAFPLDSLTVYSSLACTTYVSGTATLTGEQFPVARLLEMCTTDSTLRKVFVK